MYHLSLGYGRKNTEIYLEGVDFLKRDDLIYKEGEPLLNSYRNAEYKLYIDDKLIGSRDVSRYLVTDNLEKESK